MKIRAITVFLAEYTKDSLENYVNSLEKINDEIIWTKRIALPPMTSKQIEKVISEIPTTSKVLISAIHLRDNDNVEVIKDYLKTGDRIFASVLFRDIKNADKIIKLLKSLEPAEASRFSILYNDDFLLTPYFPVGSANTNINSLSASLIYIREFVEGKGSLALMQAEKIAREISNSLRLRYIGIDPSLSPWMEESVGRIIESMSSRIFSPGNIWAVSRINEEISKISLDSRVRVIGFSEVMLPVGEDNLLMKRVEEEQLKLYHLVSMTYTCVAGIDMVAVKISDELILNLIKDLYSIQRIKGRPIGMRILPSTGSGYVYVKGFGKIPEIKVL